MEKRKILVVDDKEINRKILCKFLGETYTIIGAEDGRKALNILETEKSISAVLLDIVMPILDGFGVLKAMSEDAFLSKIPVIVMTSEDSECSELKALSLGAADFITKPYKPEIIKHRLHNLIELSETTSLVEIVEKDSLTKIYSKVAFCQRGKKLLRLSKSKNFNIVSMDIERFKLVNDTYGLAEGDKLLKYIASYLEEFTNSHEGICARFTGDHFMMLIPESDKYIEELINKGISELETYPLEMNISLKYGVYKVNAEDIPVEVMCDRAVLAAKKIKGQYDQPYAYYDESIRESLLREQKITNEMKSALEKGQFQVFLQPKYDLNTEKIAGAESLVRWMHPEMGFLSPGEFIPLFEKNGFITELDMYVWEKTCEIISGWIKNQNRYVPVSVNVSRKDIYRPDLLEILVNLTKKYGLKPKHLHLEITETAYTENPKQLIGVVSELKNVGFIIEMDDFGSGYSSLNMLSELPINILKLDMRFIQKETKSNSSRNILSFIISLAKWMKLYVIAEGVETKEQITLLRNMDCNYVQGYYFARPMPNEEFTQALLNSEIAEPIILENVDVREGSIMVGKSSENQRIMLIIDDVKLNRDILSEFFEPLYNIVEADNGAIAYEFIKKNYSNIEVILLDLMMPVMDGFQLLEKLKNDIKLNAIPVIITSQASEASEAKALEMGAADFISKPYSLEIAVHRVSNVLAASRVQILENEKTLLLRIHEIEREAKTDFLTGLSNRLDLEKQIDEFFAFYPKGKATFIILDIDYFKRINDSLGHITGDEVIKKVGDVLRDNFRPNDVICRMGGDEYAVFIKAEIDLCELNVRLNRLCQELSFTVDNIPVTCSVGACQSPVFGNDYQTIYQNADVALLSAKRLGKNQYQIFGKETELPSSVLFRNMDWLLDEVGNGIYISDLYTNEILYMNEVACSYTNRSRKDCIGKPCYETFWQFSEPCEFCHKIDKLSNEYSEFEAYSKKTNKHYSIKSKKIDWGGRPARIQYLLDISEEKRNQEEIKRSEKVLSAVVELSNIFYWEYDMNKDLCVNGFKSINDLGMPEIMYNYPECLIESGFVHPDSAEQYRKIHKKLKEGVPKIDEVIKEVKPDGSIIWARVRYANIFDEKGKPIKALGVTNDFEQYKELEERYKIMAEESDVQTFVLDIKKRTIESDALVSEKYEYDTVIENVPESMINSGLLHPDDIDIYRNAVEAIYNGEKSVDVVTRWKKNLRDDYWYLNKTHVVNRFDFNGNPTKAFGTGRIIGKEKIE